MAEKTTMELRGGAGERRPTVVFELKGHCNKDKDNESFTLYQPSASASPPSRQIIFLNRNAMLSRSAEVVVEKDFELGYESGFHDGWEAWSWGRC